MTVRMKDIAQSLGVSQTTVSHVLRGRSGEFRIGAETAQRVREAALRFGYQPSALARSLTEIQPRNLGAFLALGRALSEAERLRPAIRAYESALALGQVPPVAHAQLARLYYRSGDLEAAREQVRLAQRRGVSLSDEFLRALGVAAAPGGEG